MAYSGPARRALAAIKRRIREQRGFSLTEVVIALAIFGVVGTSVMFALDSSSQTLVHAHEKTVAESLTRTAIEYVKYFPYDDANDPPQYSFDGVVDLSGDPYFGEYSVSLAAERLDTNGVSGDDDGIQKITVEVYYRDKLALTTQAYKVDR